MAMSVDDVAMKAPGVGGAEHLVGVRACREVGALAC